MSHPKGSISKSGHDFPNKPSAPTIPAVEKSLRQKNNTASNKAKKKKAPNRRKQRSRFDSNSKLLVYIKSFIHLVTSK